MDLLDVYRDYLTCLNERRWESLGDFVADDLSYNGRHLTLADYRTLLEDDARAIPDLVYREELLLANDDIVACRLFFDCTPQQTFLGVEPSGGRVRFPEHVFYRFHDGRIVDVWSVIDRDVIREQTRT